jgi:hypothetical protein
MKAATIISTLSLFVGIQAFGVVSLPPQKDITFELSGLELTGILNRGAGSFSVRFQPNFQASFTGKFDHVQAPMAFSCTSSYRAIETQYNAGSKRELLLTLLGCEVDENSKFSTSLANNFQQSAVIHIPLPVTSKSMAQGWALAGTREFDSGLLVYGHVDSPEHNPGFSWTPTDLQFHLQ